MTSTEDIAGLERRIQELEEQQEALRRQLAQAEIDQWEGRIDDLEVQMHLGTLELSDKLEPLLDTLRNRWLDAKEQVGQSSSTAGDVIDTLRTGLEQAMRDIRTSILEAKKVATS